MLNNSQISVANKSNIIGLGATYSVGSDRYPYTIVDVLSNNKIVVQADHAVRTDSNGFSEDQTWVMTPNPEARKIVLRLRKNGKWVENGKSLNACAFYLGHRSRYNDPCF